MIRSALLPPLRLFHASRLAGGERRSKCVRHRKLAAKMAAPNIRIRFSISKVFRALRHFYAASQSCQFARTKRVHTKGKKVMVLLRRNNLYFVKLSVGRSLPKAQPC